MPPASPPRPRASVVIPAHDEATVIGACLDALAGEARRSDGTWELDVVVVANGCHDATAAISRAAGVRVVELAEGNKAGALNAGDAATDVLPRIYLDADVVLSPGTLGHLVTALDTREAVVATPRARHDLTGASRPVRGFYRVFERLPYAREDLGGTGVYGVSAAGRARWGTFPDQLGDDLYVQRRFAPHERLLVEGHSRVAVPRTFRQLLAVRTRIARGNRALAGLDATTPAVDLSHSTGRTAEALLALVRTRPALARDVATYAAVVTLARLRARRGAPQWERDASTR